MSDVVLSQSKVISLALDVLVLDPEVQPRETMATTVIREYVHCYQDGQALPPIVVFHHDSTYRVADGFHRVLAAREAALETLDAEVYEGTQRDAILYACGANKHGKGRTDKDKRLVITRMLEDEEWRTWPFREIARHCGVSLSLVQKLFKELSDLGSQIAKPAERTVQRGSSMYTMDTSQIGKPLSLPQAGLERCALCGVQYDRREPHHICANAEVWTCPMCQEAFESAQLWHCSGCAHHWPLTRDICGNCHHKRPFEYFPPPPGTTTWAPVEPADDIARAAMPTLFAGNGQRAPALILLPDPPPLKNPPKFNRTNEMVDWAWWTWNPVTGCLHDCPYCYARDIAERYYPEKFVPTFHPDRLAAPHYTKVPPEAETQVGSRNVFVCSMADLFGKWVPQEWIDAVLAEVRAAPQWNFLFLTKFPQRLAEIDWPANAWVGTTVDEQYRVKIAERAFRDVNAPVRWLSCEPLRERLTFSSLEMFDWVVIGGQSRSSREPAMQPQWEWVEHLMTQARAAGCLVYWKPNLTVRPQEYPQHMHVR